MILEDVYLGQLPSNVMNGHVHIQAYASDARCSCPAAVTKRRMVESVTCFAGNGKQSLLSTALTLDDCRLRVRKELDSAPDLQEY